MEMRKYIVILLMFVCSIPKLGWGLDINDFCDTSNKDFYKPTWTVQAGQNITEALFNNRCVCEYDSGSDYGYTCAWPDFPDAYELKDCDTYRTKDSCEADCKNTGSPEASCYCIWSSSDNKCVSKRINVRFIELEGTNTEKNVIYGYNCAAVYETECSNCTPGKKDNCSCSYTKDNISEELIMPQITSNGMYKYEYLITTAPSETDTIHNAQNLIEVLKKFCMGAKEQYEIINPNIRAWWTKIERKIIYESSYGEQIYTDKMDPTDSSYTPLGFDGLKEKCEGLKVYGDTVPDDLYYEYNGKKYYLNSASSDINIVAGTNSVEITLHGSCPKNYYCPNNNFCNAKSCADASKFSGLPYKDLYNFVSDDNATSENECRAELKDNIKFTDNNGSFVMPFVMP